VLVVGCSFAAGDGVANETRFSDQLERLLPGVECHNYAVSGSGHDQQYLIHRRFAPLVRPDVLVVAPVVACIVRNLATSKASYDPFTGRVMALPKPYFVYENGALSLRNSPVPRISPPVDDPAKPASLRPPHILARLRRRLAGWAEPYLAEYDEPDGLPYRLARDILCRLLEESAATVKVLAPLPGREYIMTGRRPNYLPLYQDVAARTCARSVDVLAAFRRVSVARQRALLLEHDGHYSSEGHRVVAEALASAVARDGAA
jgi:hypothetical protein